MYRKVITNIERGGCEIKGEHYSLISGDLRNWDKDIVPRLNDIGFDYSLPTLFFSECCLIYLPPDSACNIMTWSSSNIASSAFIIYEQVNPSDAFGRMMIENLKV
jgi:tRNA wybutosine-synthesizing protein 4